MLDRRAFLRSALLGGGAFGLGFKSGAGGRGTNGPELLLHGYLPQDETTVRAALTAFLVAAPGELPAPVLDVIPSLRGVVAACLRTRMDDYVRESARTLAVTVVEIADAGGADIVVQDGGRVLDPSRQFSPQWTALRASVLGRPAALGFTARLADKPGGDGSGRVLVVETERGPQERVVLGEEVGTLTLAGPAGPTVVEYGLAGVRVLEASCRYRRCHAQGLICRPGELIVCAPNHLVLRVEPV